jgi:hypothetical protein
MKLVYHNTGIMSLWYYGFMAYHNLYTTLLKNRLIYGDNCISHSHGFDNVYYVKHKVYTLIHGFF